jgi:hypothetical protein
MSPFTGESIEAGFERAAEAVIVPQSSESAERRKTLIDSFFLVVLLGATALGAVRGLAGTNDPDLWLNLRLGDWILTHGTVPSQDIFSAPMMGKPWIVYHWLFAVLSERLFEVWGLRGIMALTSLLSLAATAALMAILLRYTSTVRAIALAGVAHIAMLPLGAPRSWLFTIFFFTVELWFLLQACERGKPAWLAPVVPMVALWANIHIQFVYGLGLIGLFAISESLPAASEWPLPTDGPKRINGLWLWVLLLASSVATLANPYGWRLYTVVLEYAHERAPLAVIQERQALQFRDFASWATLLLVCAAWFALGRARKKAPLLFVLLAVSCCFGFRAGRDVWFPVTASAFVLAYMLRTSGAKSGQFPGMNWAVVVSSSSLLAMTVPICAVSNQALNKSVSEHFPVAASEWIERHASARPLYNPYNWGDYLIWRFPEMPVSIDGRTNLYGDERLMRSLDTAGGGHDWAKDPELAGAKTVLLEHDSALASILRADARFQLVYEDKMASVFQRASDSRPEKYFAR